MTPCNFIAKCVLDIIGVECTIIVFTATRCLIMLIMGTELV